MICDIFRLMRPKHYIKNLLIFVCVVFDRNLFNFPVMAKCITGFVSFCFMSSVVYIQNDIRDVDSDRQHELKRNRPIASGAVSIPTALFLAVILFALSFGLNVICGLNVQSCILLGCYMLVNVGYSNGLKNVPILDIVLLVAGFLLRVLYGASIIGSFVSSWVYLTVIALSFYLSLGKRRNELKKVGAKGEIRKVLTHYSYEFLDKFMYMCLSLAIAFYALWSADDSVMIKYGTDKLVWTVPLVIVLMMKYSSNIESGSYGDPVDIITHDKWLILLSGIYVILLMGLIYYPQLVVRVS